MKIVSLLFGVPACLGLLAACHSYSGSHAAPTSLMTGTGAQWHNVNGDSDETGYSGLDQITSANAGRLGLAWYVDLPGESSLEGSPIEAEGILYFTGTYATVYAVDAASGKLIWKFDPKTWQHNPLKMNFNFASNRGAAYANGRIFSAALEHRHREW
jgi:quinohemoprotein ethanol dehydrogenase